MQDEVLKHTEKIYNTMKNREHTLWEKVREVAVEIFIIVFAVTLSIWLHNWSDHRAEQKATDEFLAGLKVDLTRDIKEMRDNRTAWIGQDSIFNYLDSIRHNKAIDTVSEQDIGDHFRFRSLTTFSNIARYDGFKSSGKLGTIENDSLKQAILSYYQQTIPSVNSLEETVNTNQTKLMDAQFDKDEKMTIRAFAKSFKAFAYLSVCRQNLEPAIQLYADAIDEAKGIVKRIDVYLKDRE
jgi:hypothetical protein